MAKMGVKAGQIQNADHLNADAVLVEFADQTAAVYSAEELMLLRPERLPLAVPVEDGL